MYVKILVYSPVLFLFSGFIEAENLFIWMSLFHLIIFVLQILHIHDLRNWNIEFIFCAGNWFRILPVGDWIIIVIFDISFV